MKRKIMSALTALMMLLAAVPAAYAAPVISASAAYESSPELRELAYEVAAITNSERAAAGLEPLSFSEMLTDAAAVRAAEIQTVFSHTRPDGSSCFTAITQTGAGYRYAGENIAYGQRSPAEVMEAWMDSPGHRANILSDRAVYIGVGVTYRSGVYYWSQFFADSDELDGEIPDPASDDEPVTSTSAATAPPQTVTTTVAATVPATVTEPVQTVTTVPAQTTALSIDELLPKDGVTRSELIRRLLDALRLRLRCFGK